MPCSAVVWVVCIESFNREGGDDLDENGFMFGEGVPQLKAGQGQGAKGVFEISCFLRGRFCFLCFVRT